jgi:tail tube protein
MKAILGINVNLEVQETLGTPKTITSIEVNTAGKSVVTATAHGFLNGAVVVFNMTSGMAQLDRQSARVANKTNDTFEIESLDVTGFEVFTSGTVTEITEFATLGAAQQVSAPNPATNKIPTTTLIDEEEQFEYGLPGAPDGTITCLFNPGGATEALIRTATVAHTDMTIRLTYADGRQTITNALVSGGYGFDLSTNDAAKSTVQFTPVRKMMHYVAL